MPLLMIDSMLCASRLISQCARQARRISETFRVPSALLARYGLVQIVHLVAAQPTRTLFLIALRCAPWVVATHLNRLGRFIAAFHLTGIYPAMGKI